MSDKMSIRERLEAVRRLADAESIDMYIVPIGDFHGSEYISDYFKCLEYLTGFTGSAGTAIIMAERAVLWTDGRYFLQAEAELRGSGIELMRSGEPDVPDLYEYIEAHLRPGMCVGFDAGVLSAEQGVAIEKIAEKCGATLQPRLDLADRVWPARPKLKFKGIFAYEDAYAGQSSAAKLAALRARLSEEKAEGLVISALDDIAWLLNLRGSDIPYNPVFFAHLIVTATELKIFAPGANAEAFRALCPGAEVQRYEDFYDALQSLPGGTSVLLDKSSVNFAAYQSILHGTQALPSTAANERAHANTGTDCSEGVTIKNISNAALLPKHIKNDTEIANIKAAHLKDGVAVTKFLFHLKKRVQNGDRLTEQDAAELLETLRRAQEDYVGPSFSPIIAYGAHGADDGTALAPAGFLLADTGGQYLQGTTDITRTIAMGPLSREQKQQYTAVLKGNLSLAATVFPEGTTGVHLDAIARRPLWALGLDYNHGTGHGVGCFLNVHEGPVAISRRSKSGGDFALCAGMLISDEPGVYLPDRYGIRLENLVLCTQAPQTPGFLAFETVTLVPFEREAVLPEAMDATERALLNAYHATVREALLPYMNKEEAAWLTEQTAPLPQNKIICFLSCPCTRRE